MSRSVDLRARLTEATARVAAEPTPKRAEKAPQPVEAAPALPLPTPAAFARVEARLRPDQVEALTGLVLRLRPRRPAASPRITINTLLRLAVDALLDHAEALTGGDEAALLGQYQLALRSAESDPSEAIIAALAAVEAKGGDAMGALLGAASTAATRGIIRS